MGKLSREEDELFERLKKKREAPDPEPINKHVHATIDFGKKEQVEMAKKYGFLPGDDDGDGDGGGDGGDGDDGGGGGAGGRKPDKTPKRGGYFG